MVWDVEATSSLKRSKKGFKPGVAAEHMWGPGLHPQHLQECFSVLLLGYLSGQMDTVNTFASELT